VSTAPDGASTDRKSTLSRWERLTESASNTFREQLAGESVDEVAFLLGHRDATVTRVVYIREIADARRRHMRRSRMIAE
jgi:hypothetical protein